MKIPTAIICTALSALIALEGWTLNEVINLKVSVAALSQRVTEIQPKHLAQTQIP